MEYLFSGIKGLPDVLQSIILEYFSSKEVPEAYEWYLSVVKDIRNLGFLRKLCLRWATRKRTFGTNCCPSAVGSESLGKLYLLPRLKLLKYLDIFLEEGRREAVKAILECRPLGRIDRLLIETAKRGHLEVVKYLISQGDTAFDGAFEGAFDAAFNWAVYSGQLGVVKYLMSQKNVDLGVALYGAANGSQREMVQYLISQGADLDGAICWAIKYGHPTIVEYLKSCRPKANYL